MKQFCSKIFFLCFFWGTIIVAVNYLSDPAHLFTDGFFEKQIAAMLVKGNIVVGPPDYDQRLVYKYYIEDTRTEPVQTLVLGSSRGLCISQKTAKDTSSVFFNSCVNGASLRDVITLFYLWHKKAPVKKVIVEVFPNWFNEEKERGEVRWQSLKDDYREALSLLGVQDTTITAIRSNIWNNRYFQLISPAYFRTSFPKLLADKNYFVGDSLSEEAGIYPDGTLKHPSSALVPSLKRNIEIPPRISRLITWAEITPQWKYIFETWIYYMKKEQVEIVFYLSPYHPKLYELFVESESAVLDVEKQVKEFARQNHIVLSGSYDPAQYGVTDSDFLDGIHLNPLAIRLILDDTN